MAQIEEYRLSFTSGGLLYEESTRIAAIQSEIGDWEQTRMKAQTENVLQARTPSSNSRRVREVCARLQNLTDRQFRLFQDSVQADQLLLLWLAVCKRYVLLREFADQVVRNHFLSLQLVLGREEFDRFMENSSVWHPEVENLSQSTKTKLGSVTYQMLREAGILSAQLLIQPVLLSREIARAIVVDSVELLHIYPIADSDVLGAAR